GRDHALAEDLRHLFGRCRIDLAIERYDPAKRRNRIRSQSFFVSVSKSLSETDARWICVLDDGARGLFKVADELPRRFGIDVVVERHLFTGEDGGVRDAATR